MSIPLDPARPPIDKKWLHWCEPCKAFVAHVNAHGVSENEALVRRAEQAEAELAKAHVCPACGETTIARDSARVAQLEADLARASAEGIKERMREALTPPPAGRDILFAKGQARKPPAEGE